MRNAKQVHRHLCCQIVFLLALSLPGRHFLSSASRVQTLKGNSESDESRGSNPEQGFSPRSRDSSLNAHLERNPSSAKDHDISRQVLDSATVFRREKLIAPSSAYAYLSFSVDLGDITEVLDNAREILDLAYNRTSDTTAPITGLMYQLNNAAYRFDRLTVTWQDYMLLFADKSSQISTVVPFPPQFPAFHEGKAAKRRNRHSPMKQQQQRGDQGHKPRSSSTATSSFPVEVHIGGKARENASSYVQLTNDDHDHPDDNDSPGRERRAPLAAVIPLIIGAVALGTAATGSALGIFSIQQLKELQRNQRLYSAQQELMLTHLDRHEQLLAASKLELHQIRIINEEQKNVTTGLWNYWHASEVISDVLWALQIAQKTVDERINALDFLLQNALSPRLISRSVAFDALQAVIQTAALNGFEVPDTSPAFIYKTRASFLMEGRRLLVIVALPVYKPEEIYAAYSLNCMPIRLPNSHATVQIAPEYSHIAVNKKRDYWIPLSKEILDECDEFAAVTICTNINFKLKNFQNSCISSLFEDDAEGAKQNCPVVFVPDKTKIVQISETEFLIYHAKKLSLTISCGPSEAATHSQVVRFQGLRKVKLGEQCLARSRDYLLEVFPDFHLNMTVITDLPRYVLSDMDWSVKDLVGDIELPKLDTLVPQHLLSPLPVQDILKQFHQLKPFVPSSVWLPPFGAAVCLIAIAVAALCLLICCCRRKLATTAARLAMDQTQHMAPRTPPIYRPDHSPRPLRREYAYSTYRAANCDDPDDQEPFVLPPASEMVKLPSPLHTPATIKRMPPFDARLLTFAKLNDDVNREQEYLLEPLPIPPPIPPPKPTLSIAAVAPIAASIERDFPNIAK
jgi:hypothetical protein